MHKSKPFATFNPSKLITKHKTMTKTSIFGKSEVKQEEKKPIEFVKFIDYDEIVKAEANPIHFKNVVLLGRNFQGSDLDVIWAYHDEPNLGGLFLGYWNDGVV